MTVPEISKRLSKVRALEAISPELIKRMATVTSIVALKQGEFLWRQGEPARSLVVITEGLIEIGKISSRGDSLILAFFGPNDVIGVTANLRKALFPANAIVATKVMRGFKIYISGLNGELSQDQEAELQHWLRDGLLSHEHVLREKIDLIGLRNIEQKMFQMIRHLVLRFGIKEGKKATIPFLITKTRMAQFMELRTETTIRLLGKWQKKGYLEFSSSGIIINDIESLEREIDRG